LTELLQSPLPFDLQVERLGVPSAFSRLDLMHFDVLSLGRRFVKSFPDRSQPILLLGLRTAGTSAQPPCRIAGARTMAQASTARCESGRATLVMNHLMTSLRLDRLSYHDTMNCIS
jgi:hypothetical protein